MIDIHNHILPAWDDGPATLIDTFTMARQAVSVGTTVMAATPHRMAATGYSNTERVRRRVAQLNDELALEGIALEIVPGVEVPISNTIVDELKAGLLSPIADGNYVLIEPPFPNLPEYLLPSIRQLLDAGYGAVLAHPERNSSVQSQFTKCGTVDFVTAAADLGCVIQLTSGSIVGRFGKTAQAVTQAIAIHRDWKIVIASDSHDPRERTPEHMGMARDVVAGWIGDSVAAAAMVEDLPRRIIGR